MKTILLTSISLLLLVSVTPSTSDAQWVQTNGPFGGGTNALVAIGDTLFACVNGSVYRSTDNGTSWSVTTLMSSLVNSLVAGGENLYAVTGGLGVLLSTDRGIEWNAINNTLPSLNVYTLVSSGPDLFVSLRNSIVRAPGYGIYRSKDNGISWAAANTGLTDPDVRVLNVCAAASGDTDIYAGTQSGVFLSTNRGGSWNLTGMQNIGISALAAIPDGAGGTSILAGTSRGVFRSTDRGVSWIAISTGLMDTNMSAFAFRYNGSGSPVIFAGDQEGDVYTSTNNGQDWSVASSGLLVGSWEWGANIRCLTVVGTNTFASTSAGIFLSIDNGKNWAPVNNGVSCASVNALAAAPGAAGNTVLLAGTFPSGMFRSTDSGSHWTAVNDGISSTDFNTIAVTSKGVLAGSSTGVFLSTNNGANWNSIGPPNRSEVVSLLAASNGNGDTDLFAGTWNGTFVSRDFGRTWDSVGLGPEVSALAAGPAGTSGTNIFAGTIGSGVFSSSNAGVTWNPSSIGLPKFTNINGLSFCGNTLFTAAEHGVYYSSNNGANWHSTNLALPVDAWISSIVVDLGSKGDTNIIAGTSTGVYVSTDAGTTWKPDNTGPLQGAVASLLISGTNIFAGTRLNGVWRRPLSELLSGVQRPASQIAYQYSLSQNYPNPFNPSTTIRYTLPGRAHVNLTVFNTLGQQVSTLVNEIEEAGYHDVRFDGRDLASGIYFYRLQAGDYISTRKLNLMR